MKRINTIVTRVHCIMDTCDIKERMEERREYLLESLFGFFVVVNQVKKLFKQKKGLTNSIWQYILNNGGEQ